MAKPRQVIKTFKKGDVVRRTVSDFIMSKKGYIVVSEEETKERSLLKTGILAIIFLPLALAGNSNKVKVTYELQS